MMMASTRDQLSAHFLFAIHVFSEENKRRSMVKLFCAGDLLVTAQTEDDQQRRIIEWKKC